jgi:hypothetical protein
MKTATKNIHTDYTFQRSVYNPTLDHSQGEVLFKEKIEEGKAFFKKYGLPKKIMDKLKSEMNQNNNQ